MEWSYLNMERIIYDYPGDDPNEEREPSTPGRYDLNPVYEAVTTVLDATRPDRYQERDVAWQAKAEELAFEMLMNDSDASESIIKETAIRAVRNREGVAKSKGGDLFARAADQLPLGYGDPNAMRDFLRGLWHLPIRINADGDMVRLGAMLPADWNEKDSYQKQAAKERAARDQMVSDGIGIFKGFADAGGDDVPFEGLFDAADQG